MDALPAFLTSVCQDVQTVHVKRFQDAGLQMVWHVYPKVHTIMGEELHLIRDFVTKRMTESEPVGEAAQTDTIPATDWDLADIWYATSKNGFDWE